MFYTIKISRRKIFISLLVLIVLVFGAAHVFKPPSSTETVSAASGRCIAIDPGHGGIDGGAVSIGGIKESDINLAIALRLQELAWLYGEEAVMTRTDDIAKTDAANYSEHEELVYRTKLINSAPNAVLFSIHQNCFPTEVPSGAQVLYAQGDNSQRLGEITHNNIIDFLQPENRRVAEPAPKNLYITANVSCPAVLVECGFMSNFSDIEKLRDEEYQTSLAAVLMASYLQYRNYDSIG